MVVTRQTIRRNSLSYSILTSFDRGAIEKTERKQFTIYHYLN